MQRRGGHLLSVRVRWRILQLLLQSRMTLPLPPPLSFPQSQCQCQITFTRPARPVPHTLAGFCTKQAEELWVFRPGNHGRSLIYDLHFSGLHFISEIDTFSINAGVSICIRDYDTIYQHNDISLIEWNVSNNTLYAESFSLLYKQIEDLNVHRFATEKENLWKQWKNQSMVCLTHPIVHDMSPNTVILKIYSPPSPPSHPPHPSVHFLLRRVAVAPSQQNLWDLDKT